MSRHITVGIVDYGVGNLGSVITCIKNIGFSPNVTRSKVDMIDSDVILLPGVGAFPLAMQELKETGLDEVIRELFASGKPLIGICLGMQVLTDESDEIRVTKGLGIIPGRVERLEGADWHIGWNSLSQANEESIVGDCQSGYYFFNHSYCFRGEDKYVLARSRISDQTPSFPAIVKNKNAIGIQFHPEKSQVCGKRLLNNIIVRMTNNAY